MDKLMQEAVQPFRARMFNRDNSKPKERRILVLKTGIAGMQYYIENDEERKAIDEIIPGTELILYREPDNVHDELAIAVYADEDGEEGAEDVTVDTTTEPSRMFYHERRLKILCEAFDNLKYRERAIIAEHLGFCENCWSPYYFETVNGRKVKREYEKTAFIDLAGEHDIVLTSADRIYRGAIGKLRKALEEDTWL